jgi:hypothetical protein
MKEDKVQAMITGRAFTNKFKPCDADAQTGLKTVSLLCSSD